jgi:dienelactone hydrolase
MRALPLFGSLVVLLATVPARADTCHSVGQVVTYYSEPDKSVLTAGNDPRCSIVRPAGVSAQPVCRIALKGTLYLSSVTPPTGGLPAIIYNHGSEHNFDAETKACAIADYFGPKGFHVFVPFRRGQGEIPDACLGPKPTDSCDKRDHARASTLDCPLGPNESTGKYISQALDEYTATSACSKGCEFTKLLDAQTADVIEAVKWMIARSDTADDKIVIMGNSYGGMMTVLTNSKSGVGHKAAVAFSPGAISWSQDDGSPNKTLQPFLKAAAAKAKTSTYFLQGQWDYDTRAGIEQALQQSGDPTGNMHSAPFALQIFAVDKPPADPCKPGQLDWQEVHAGFAKDTAKWGPSVSDFLERNGVK